MDQSGTGPRRRRDADWHRDAHRVSLRLALLWLTRRSVRENQEPQLLTVHGVRMPSLANAPLIAVALLK